MTQTRPALLLDELEKLESLRDDISGHHRRRDLRFVVRGNANLINLNPHRNQNIPTDAMLRDISRGGVGFLTDRSLDVGSVWRMQFIQQNYGIGETDVIIRFTREIEKHVHIVGCQICMQSGLLYLMGVSPPNIDSATMDITPSDTFVAPEDVQ